MRSLKKRQKVAFIDCWFFYTNDLQHILDLSKTILQVCNYRSNWGGGRTEDAGSGMFNLLLPPALNIISCTSNTWKIFNLSSLNNVNKSKSACGHIVNRPLFFPAIYIRIFNQSTNITSRQLLILWPELSNWATGNSLKNFLPCSPTVQLQCLLCFWVLQTFTFLLILKGHDPSTFRASNTEAASSDIFSNLSIWLEAQCRTVLTEIKMTNKLKYLTISG